jgi:hypothetical protein
VALLSAILEKIKTSTLPIIFHKDPQVCARQTRFDWTTLDLDEKIIGHIMARFEKSCLTLTYWTFGSLTSDINTLSNKCLNCAS